MEITFVCTLITMRKYCSPLYLNRENAPFCMGGKKRQEKAPVGRSRRMRIKNYFENRYLRYVIAVFDNTNIQVLCFIRYSLPEIENSKFKNIRF